MNKSQFLINSFLRYTKITSQSNPANKHIPSTPGQMEMALALKSDLEALHITDIQLFENSILIAKIPANTKAPSVSFMAHTDTTDIGANPDIHAHIINFTGNDFILNKEKNIIFKVNEHPHIKQYINDQIIVTDGTSVLGADDKAGVTVMMGLATYLTSHNIPHGDVYLTFVPDEEIGLKGSYALDLKYLPVDYSYTIDGGPIGEFGYETFNGAGASIHIKGVSIHPGKAKGILVNPILVANDFISKLDKMDTPEHSEGHEGFILVHDIKGNPSEAIIDLIIRDFDIQKFNARKQFIQNLCQEIQQMHPKAIITCSMEDSYANIANNLTNDNTPISIVEDAMQNININIHTEAIRGGTDGAVLSSKGLITPNIFTGAHNIHSIFEYLPVNSFVKSLDTVIEIVSLLGSKYSQNR